MIKTSSTGYVTIKLWPHTGEHAVPTGKRDGEKAEFILLNCIHKEHKIWLERKDI